MKGGDGKVGNDPKDVDTYFDMLETAGAQRGRPEDLEQTTTRNAAFTGGARKLTVRQKPCLAHGLQGDELACVIDALWHFK